MSGFQNKTIKKVIERKLEDWTSTFDMTDPEQRAVKTLIQRDAIVSGGCIASMAMGDPIHDFDVYFRTKETALAVAHWYTKRFRKENGHSEEYIKVREEKITNINGEEEDRICIVVKSNGVETANDHLVSEEENFENDPSGDVVPKVDEEEDEKAKYRPIFLSSNAISLSQKIQLIIRFFGDPKEIHKNYDYIHAMCYYDWHKNELSMPEKAIRSMQSKTLYYAGSLYPICSLFRMRKFINRGWKISAGEIFKMAFQISRINLSDPAVLRDQLTGCDAAYFHYLIAAIEKLEPDQYNQMYIFEIIERIFGDS